MCLILFAYRSHPEFPLIMVANRDERYDRPTAPAAFWEDSPDVLAGRDLKAGGTWLGVTRQGKFAAITNLRGSINAHTEVKSRGHLVRDFLVGNMDPLTYSQNVLAEADRYSGFNLLVGDSRELIYCNNNKDLTTLTPGIYGLSNHRLNSPWPKVVRGKAGLEKIMEEHSTDNPVTSNKLLALVADKSKVNDDELPNTGVGIELERTLSPMFIESGLYGTCLSTSIIINNDNQVQFKERGFYKKEAQENIFDFKVEE